MEQLSVQEYESATLYGALVNPSTRKQVRAVLGVGGARFFETVLFRDIYDGLVERSPDVPLWDAEVLDWASRTRGRELTSNERLEILRIFSGNSIASTGAYYAARVVDEGKKRLAGDFAQKLFSMAGTSTPSEIHAAIERTAREIAPHTSTGPTPISDALDAVMAEIEAGDCARVMTGFPKLDELMGGLAPGNLFVIGAGTGRGKTALAVNILVNAAREGLPVSFFALEMSVPEVTRRILSVEGGLALRKDMTPASKPELLASTYERVAAMPIQVSASQGFNTASIEASFEHSRVNGFMPSLVIVDYLQLMESSDRASNRQEQVAEVSRGLKRLAMRYEVPFIVLSQLRRLNDTEEADARPGLHHLRESGAIEQDADAVLLLSNERVNRSHYERVMLADLAKNRHGPIGDLKLIFNTQTQRMVEE
jgi:replicative DNA helicase